MNIPEYMIADLRMVLDAAREHIRLNEPEDMATAGAIDALEALIEAHENA